MQYSAGRQISMFTEAKYNTIHHHEHRAHRTMFTNTNQQFLSYKEDSVKISKRSLIKTINVLDTKASLDVIGSPKKNKKAPTSGDVLNDFLECTSVHGLQYFGKTDVKVGTCGKILWTCTILVGFVCVSLMVMQFLHRYSDNPTNTYIKAFFAPIFKAPFPAVTICPFAPIPKHRRLGIIENIILPENMSREHAMEILKYSHHITLPYAMKKYNELKDLKMLLQANNWNLTDFLKILKPCEDIMDSCWWSDERIDCTSYFKISHTCYGLCCSFNYLLEEFVGREKEQPKPMPMHSVTFGRKSGLNVIIKEEIFAIDTEDRNDFTKRMTNSDGILVLIHNSMDYPGLNTNARILQKDHELEIGIQPELHKKPAGLYHHNDHHELVSVCIQDTENVLNYFPTYRYSNCYANCRIEVMISICGCIPFIYDYIAEYYNIKRCEIDGLLCIQNHARDIGIVRDIKRENFTCSCRTPCEDVTYDNFPNVIGLTLKHTSSNYQNISDNNAILRVFMNSQVFQVLETIPSADEIYLLASIGGIFSLFLGCSFLSLVEIVYFSGLLCRAFLCRKKSETRLNKKRVRYNNFIDAKPYIH